jgi:hypothetical protein
MAQALLQDPAQVRPVFGIWSIVGIAFSPGIPILQFVLGICSDATNIWSIFLMAVGFSAVHPESIPLRKALGIVLFFWLVLGAIDVVVHVAR